MRGMPDTSLIISVYADADVAVRGARSTGTETARTPVQPIIATSAGAGPREGEHPLDRLARQEHEDAAVAGKREQSGEQPPIGPPA